MTDLPPAAAKPRIVIDFDDPPVASPSAASVHIPLPPAHAALPPTPLPLWSTPAHPASTPARAAALAVAPATPTPFAQPATAYASWAQRAGALIIDSVIIGTVCFVLLLLLFGAAAGSVDSETGDGAVTALGVALLGPLVAFFLVTLCYAPVLMARGGANNGMTWGKQLMGIRVQHADGRPMTFGSSLVREVLAKGAIGVISAFTFAIVSIIDLLWPLWDAREQTLHDKMATTVVTRA